MKQIKIILLPVIFIHVSITYGQDLKIVNTKELVSIANTYGLDSALKITYNEPLYFLDPETAAELARLIEHNEYCEETGSFIINYSLNSDLTELPEILNKFIEIKIALITDMVPDLHFNKHIISDNELIAVIKHANNRTESVLIRYYEQWLKKADSYKEDHIKAIFTPFIDCHLNCYNILLALDSLKSNYADSLKFNKHKQYLSKNFIQTALHEEKYKQVDYNKQNPTDTIFLKKNYKTIGEIDFYNEPDFNELFSGFHDSSCLRLLLYNDNNAYIKLDCPYSIYGGSGLLYKIELIDNKRINIYFLDDWVYI